MAVGRDPEEGCSLPYKDAKERSQAVHANNPASRKMARQIKDCGRIREGSPIEARQAVVETQEAGKA